PRFPAAVGCPQGRATALRGLPGHRAEGRGLRRTALSPDRPDPAPDGVGRPRHRPALEPRAGGLSLLRTSAPPQSSTGGSLAPEGEAVPRRGCLACGAALRHTFVDL